MKISYTPTMYGNTKYNQPTFCMKKSEFSNFDRYIVEKTKAPIGRYKVVQEFYDYCNGLINELFVKFKKSDFGGRQRATKVQRKSMLREWFNYVINGNSAYTASIKYMVLEAITKDLKPDNDKLPPVLDKGALAAAVEAVHEKLDADKKAQFNFVKEYKMKLQNNIVTDVSNNNESLNGWIIIPSKAHDFWNFSQNVKKLKTLSHSNWCTSSFNAKPYLSEGDFHVYMENGRPKLGVRFVGDEIEEIQGEKNNCIIPYRYYDIAIEHAKQFKLNKRAQAEINRSEKYKEEIQEIFAQFPNGIKNATTQEILNAFGINCRRDDDGLLIVSEFGNPRPSISWNDFGIDVNKLLKDIKIIEGNANFNDKYITSLGSVEHIGGNAEITNQKLSDLGKLKSVDKDLYLYTSNNINANNIEFVGGTVFFAEDNDVKSQYIKNLKSRLSEDVNSLPVTEIFDILGIKYRVDTDGLLIIDNFKRLSDLFTYSDLGINVERLLDKVKIIEGYACFTDLKLENLGNVTYIGGDAYFDDAKIRSTGKLAAIGGDMYCSKNTRIKDWGELNYIAKGAGFANRKQEMKYIKHLKKKFPNGVKKATPQELLEAFNIKCRVDDDGLLIISHFKTPNVTYSDLGVDVNMLLRHIKRIEGDADFRDDKIKSLGSIESIGGDVKFYIPHPHPIDISSLKYIGGDLNNYYSTLKLTDVANVEIRGLTLGFE